MLLKKLVNLVEHGLLLMKHRTKLDLEQTKLLFVLIRKQKLNKVNSLVQYSRAVVIIRRANSNEEGSS